jgi:hypothetical protein
LIWYEAIQALVQTLPVPTLRHFRRLEHRIAALNDRCAYRNPREGQCGYSILIEELAGAYTLDGIAP